MMRPSPSRPKNSCPRLAAEAFGHSRRGAGRAVPALQSSTASSQRRYKTPVGEIDLVARRFGTTVFVEVKARGRGRTEAEALVAVNRRRIVRAAEYYVARHPALARDPAALRRDFPCARRAGRAIFNAFDAS